MKENGFLAAYSDKSGPPIPIQSDHLFRGKMTTLRRKYGGIGGQDTRPRDSLLLSTVI